jgi:hypothetical protein
MSPKLGTTQAVLKENFINEEIRLPNSNSCLKISDFSIARCTLK